MSRLTKLLVFTVVAATITISSVSTSRGAGPLRLPNGWLRVFISNRPVVPVAQQTPVWCWAASLSALFGYYGHPINQTEIDRRYFPPGVVTTGNPLLLENALNTVWRDDNGQKFRISSRITNRFPVPPMGAAGPYQVSNQDIINALQNERAVFYADQTHAMILVQVDYVLLPTGPRIFAGAAIDPEPRWAPCPPFGRPCIVATGFRPLRPFELTGMFAAIPTSFVNLP